MVLYICIGLFGGILHTTTWTMEPAKEHIKQITQHKSLPVILHKPKNAENTRKSDPTQKSKRTRNFRSTSFIVNSPRKNKQKNKKQQSEELVLFDKNNINATDHCGNTYLICATKRNDIAEVTEILEIKDLNINHQNMVGNTALHFAAMSKYNTIITVLLHDHRTNAFIKNNQQLCPRDCYTSNNAEENKIKFALFARTMLNIAIHEEAFAVLVSCQQHEPAVLENAITMVKERILNNYESQQKRQPIPTDYCLPNYATNEFLQKMIEYKIRLKQL